MMMLNALWWRRECWPCQENHPSSLICTPAFRPWYYSFSSRLVSFISPLLFSLHLHLLFSSCLFSPCFVSSHLFSYHLLFCHFSSCSVWSLVLSSSHLVSTLFFFSPPSSRLFPSSVVVLSLLFLSLLLQSHLTYSLFVFSLL